MSAPRRRAEIDALKAAGIVTIILIHSIRPPWDPHVSATEIWIGHITRFGVAAFLFASGFLYAQQGPVALATTLRRLRRILVPYLIATAIALWLYPDATAGGDSSPLATPWRELLLGCALGPYYYVFVIAGLVAVTPLLARLTPAAIGMVAIGLLAAQWAVDAAFLVPLEIFWHLRNPLLWWAYFALGWWLRRNGEMVTAWTGAHRGAIVATLSAAVVALTAVAGLEGQAPQLFVRTGAWLHTYAVLALIFALTVGRAFGGSALRLASDATYPIYLFHLFFLYPVQARLPLPPGELALLPVSLVWAAGFFGPLLLVAASRALLGERSRDVLGA